MYDQWQSSSLLLYVNLFKQALSIILGEIDFYLIDGKQYAIPQLYIITIN